MGLGYNTKASLKIITVIGCEAAFKQNISGCGAQFHFLFDKFYRAVISKFKNQSFASGPTDITYPMSSQDLPGPACAVT